MSLQKEDSLLVLVNVTEAKKVSALQDRADLDKNSFESKSQNSDGIFKVLNMDRDQIYPCNRMIIVEALNGYLSQFVTSCIEPKL